MRNSSLSQNSQEIKTVRFLPQDAGLEPLHPVSLPLQGGISTVLSNLFGQCTNGGILIGATDSGALKVASQGVSFTTYTVKTGTAPAAYNTADLLTATSGIIHRWDILIEAQEAIISFYNSATGAWMGSIPLTVGNHSIDFESSSCRIAKRGGTAGTYSIIGWQ